MTEITIKAPEGKEIDQEALKEGRIVFKNTRRVLKWTDIKTISGSYISERSKVESVGNRTTVDVWDKKLFASEKYAESALAFAQLSQVYQYYNKADYENFNIHRYCIVCKYNRLEIISLNTYKEFFMFNTEKEAQLFLKNNEELLKKFYMID